MKWMTTGSAQAIVPTTRLSRARAVHRRMRVAKNLRLSHWPLPPPNAGASLTLFFPRALPLRAHPPPPPYVSACARVDGCAPACLQAHRHRRACAGVAEANDGDGSRGAGWWWSRRRSCGACKLLRNCSPASSSCMARSPRGQLKRPRSCRSPRVLYMHLCMHLCMHGRVWSLCRFLPAYTHTCAHEQTLT